MNFKMNDNGECQFEINDNGNFIRIIPLKFIFPDAEMDWDRNFIETQIEVNAPPFQGKYKSSLMTVDFEKFKQELKRIYNDLAGTTRFDSLESEIDIKIKGDGIGHFKVNCTATDRSMFDGSELAFVLHFDQTHIPELIKLLEEITTTFPISGDVFRIKNQL